MSKAVEVITKGWCINMAKREDGGDISAGKLAVVLSPPTQEQLDYMEQAQAAKDSYDPTEVLGK